MIKSSTLSEHKHLGINVQNLKIILRPSPTKNTASQNELTSNTKITYQTNSNNKIDS